MCERKAILLKGDQEISVLLIGEGKDQVVEYPPEKKIAILSKGPSSDADIVNVNLDKCTLTVKGQPNGGFQEVLVENSEISLTLFQAAR
jgi:hypothetical protein